MGLTIGVIGLTHPHSAMHLRTLDSLDPVERVALYDPDAGARERAAQASGKTERTYDQLDSLLARQDVPIVFVVLPNDLTPGVVIRAAQAGKHVICEKPCARSAAEMRPVLDVLARHQVQFAVCYIWRTNPSVVKLRELVSTGAIGRLTSVELRMVTSQVKMRDPSHWLFRNAVAGGGIVSWLGCHWLDLLRYVTGEEVVEVAALLGTLSGEAIDVEDIASVSMRLSGGALASLYAGYLLPWGRAGYEGATFDQSLILRGSDGTLRLDQGEGEQRVTLHSVAGGWRTAPRQVYQYTLPTVSAYGGAHGLALVEGFIRATQANEIASSASAVDALRVLEILDAIYSSAQNGRVAQCRRWDGE